MAIQIFGYPPKEFFGEKYAAAHARLEKALIGQDDAQVRVSELMRGGRRPSPHDATPYTSPSDVERQAIAKDQALEDEAVAEGRPISDIGTPHRDAYRRDLAEADRALAAHKRAVAQAQIAILGAVRDETPLALTRLRDAGVEAKEALQGALDEVEARAKHVAEIDGTLRFVRAANEPSPTQLSYAAAIPDRLKTPGRVHSIGFSESIGALRLIEPAPVTELDAPADDAAPADAQPATTESILGAELPKRTRQRLEKDGNRRSLSASGRAGTA